MHSSVDVRSVGQRPGSGGRWQSRRVNPGRRTSAPTKGGSPDVTADGMDSFLASSVGSTPPPAQPLTIIPTFYGNENVAVCTDCGEEFPLEGDYDEDICIDCNPDIEVVFVKP